MLASLKAKIAEQVELPPDHKLRLMLPSGQVVRGKVVGPLLRAEVEKDEAGCEAEDEVEMVKSRVAAAAASSTEPSEEPESEANEKCVEGDAEKAMAVKKKKKKEKTFNSEEVELVKGEAGAKANAASEARAKVAKAKATIACGPELSKEPESGEEANMEVDVASRSGALKALREKRAKNPRKTISSNAQQAALAEKQAEKQSLNQ